METTALLMALACAFVQTSRLVAAELPTALELVFHDAVRYQPMDVQSAAAHLKDPTAALKPAADKDGKQAALVVAPLHVYLDLDQPSGKVRQAMAAQEVRRTKAKGQPPPWENYSVHPADGSGLQWKDGRLAGTLSLTVNPDMTHHYQRAPAVCKVELSVAPGTEGAYKGRYGEYDIKGKVTCEAPKTPDLAQPCETTLMLNNAMNLPGIGPNAPRGCLNAAWKDGKAIAANLGDTYGYNLWTAIVEAGGLTLRDGRLTGQLVGHVTSSYQDKYAGECKWTLDAVVVGRRVLGAGRGQRTTSKGQTQEFAIAINGLIANTADVPDVKAWWLDHDNRAREAAGDPGYWHGRNPKDKEANEKGGKGHGKAKDAP